jgi:hypothetical protein
MHREGYCRLILWLAYIFTRFDVKVLDLVEENPSDRR